MTTETKPTTDELAAERDARAKAIQLIHDVERTPASAQQYIVNALMMFYHRGGIDALEESAKRLEKLTPKPPFWSRP